MSGIKDVLVTMTRTGRDWLLNNAQRAAESAEQARQRERTSQNALNAANSKLDALNRALNNEIAGLHDDMRRISNEQNKRFMEQASEYNRRFQEQKSETDRKLRHQEADFSRRLENQGRELQSAINDVRQQAENNRKALQNQINGISARIEAKENNAKKIAEFWISQTQAYFNDIEQYRHEMFTPGQLERLKGKLKQMLSDINNGMYEAAIATARGLFNDAVDLKEVVLNAETEWLYYHGLFLQTLADTEANLNYCEKLQFTFEMEYGTETVNAQVNYWTNGILDEISTSISEVKQKTEQIQSVSTQQLIDYIDILNRQNIKMEIASDEAKEAMILSQTRSEMANKLADALEEVAWNCERITYEGGEQDQPVHVKLSDGMGNEIVAIITPEINTQNMSNKLELHFFDKKNDEKERQQWIASIENSLKQEGLEVGETKCVKGYEARPSDKMEVKDINATAQRKVERLKRQNKEVLGDR